MKKPLIYAGIAVATGILALSKRYEIKKYFSKKLRELDEHRTARHLKKIYPLMQQ